MRVIRCKRCAHLLARCQQTSMSHYDGYFHDDANKLIAEWEKDVLFPNVNICTCPYCGSKHYFEYDANGIPELKLYF